MNRRAVVKGIQLPLHHLYVYSKATLHHVTGLPKFKFVFPQIGFLGIKSLSSEPVTIYMYVDKNIKNNTELTIKFFVSLLS